jgi:formylglycine-generating enzyme required for sulfatase activity
MHGNVYEWCHDYYKQSREKGPQGLASGSFRVLQSGSWGSSMRATRSDFRLRNDANYGHYVGFRLVRELD